MNFISGEEKQNIKAESREDCFDRLMRLPGFRIFEPFYKKHREALLYLLFGGLAFFLNIGLFAGLDLLGLHVLVNNVICWLICVLFQFFTNRTWVFDGRVDGMKAFLKQMGGFFVGRLATLAAEEVILAVFITGLGMNAAAVKLAAQVLVIVLNYLISKLLVFRKQQYF